MQNIFTEQGSLVVANLLKTAIANNWALGLFQNAHSPIFTDTFAALVESTFPGYARQQHFWGATSAPPGARLSQGGNTFTRSVSGPAQLVYGYFLLDLVTGNLVYAERDQGGPFSLATAGESYFVVPQFTVFSQYLT